MSDFDLENAYGDLSSFNGRVIQPGLEADRWIAEIGGLPEITRAAADLQVALDQTAEEIRTAELAGRFPNVSVANWEQFAEGRPLATVRGLSPAILSAGMKGGEAEMKRASLLLAHTALQDEMHGLIDKIVRLRADLKLAQEEF